MLKAIYSTVSCILFLSQICAMNQNIGASGTQQNSQQWQTLTDSDFGNLPQKLSNAGIKYKIQPLRQHADKHPTYQNEATFRKDTTEKTTIVVSNTHSCTIERYENSCYERGISSQFVIDYDGTVFMTVPCEGYVSFMSGQSKYFNMSSLNKSSINIQVLGGAFYDEKKANESAREKTNEESLKKAKTDAGQTIIKKDGIEWFKFTNDQQEALGKLCRTLCDSEDFKIRYIAGLGDVNYKHVAPGFCLDWKKLFDDYKVGFYPNKETVEEVAEVIKSLPEDQKEKVIDSLLKLCGYDSEYNLEVTLDQRIWHFCVRYQQELFTEKKFEYSNLSIDQKNTILAALLVTAKHYVATLNLISNEGFSDELDKITLDASGLHKELFK